MTNKFKMLLKTTAAVATLMMGSQSWAAGVWYDADTAIPTGTPWAPATATVNALLSQGDGSTAATAFNPTVAVETINISVAAQIADCANALTVTLLAPCVINVTNHSAPGNTFLLTMAGGFDATINLLKGDVTLAAPAAAPYMVNVVEDLTLTPGANAAALSYKVATGKTLTLASAFVQTSAGRMQVGKNALITTPAAACTLRLD